METLVAVAQHQNQYYSRDKSQGPARFGSSPSEGFRDINCRTFESGLLTTPLKKTRPTPQYNKSLPSPRTPNLLSNSTGRSKSEEPKNFKRTVKSSPIPINFKGGSGKKEWPLSGNISVSELCVGPTCSNFPFPIKSLEDGKKTTHCDCSFSERWAGPTYSNSPPPSCLPMPKFSVKPKRTVSLELPVPESDLNLPPMAKSAPASPTRNMNCSPASFLADDDTATKALCRILNLNISDD